MGEATFLSESLTGVASPVPVRLFTRKDVKSAAAILKGNEGKQFDALVALRGALEANDELALAKATAQMEEVYQEQERKLAPEWNAPENDGSRLRWAELLKSLHPGPKTRGNPSRLLSFEVYRTVGLLNTQIVLWWAGERFIPAIFCLDMTTGLYLHTFFIAPVGEIGFRICPHCRNQFFQNRANQDYCCPAHREAHRVARFRNEKKLRAKEIETNRKSNGTHKTR